MACDLTGGRKKPCKDAVGGVVKVHFVDFGDLGTVTVGSNDEITDMSGTFSYSTYDVKGLSLIHI
jgi:hypothetical protein